MVCGLLLCADGPSPVLFAEASDPALAMKVSNTSTAVTVAAANPYVLVITFPRAEKGAVNHSGNPTQELLTYITILPQNNTLLHD
jgi:hypothetical protein